MTNKKKKPQTISIDTFAEAFITLFKCKREEIEIEMTEENQSASVIYGMEEYEVNTREWLLDDVIGMLTYIDQAQSMPIFIWLFATIGILSNNKFYINLVEALNDEIHFYRLHLALSISSFAPNKEEIFWNTLWNVDKDGDLFGNAIVAAAKTYDLDTLAEEILTLQIIYGFSVYNPNENGIFKQVSLKQKNGSEQDFFIYPAM